MRWTWRTKPWRRTWTAHTICNPHAESGAGSRRMWQQRGIPIAPGGAGFVGQPATQGAEYSNITKMFANWNVCYTCGFNIKDGHTLVMSPRGWRKPNHQEGFDRNNAQAYIDAGWKPSTKGRHKTQFQGF